MRQATARYFFRLKYHQGYYQACKDIDKLLRAVRVKPYQRSVVTMAMEWAEKELKAWDESEDKKDWRNDQPPRLPLFKLLGVVRKLRDPEKHDAVPFLDEGLESVMTFEMGDLDDQ